MNPKRATFVVVVSAALAVLGPAQPDTTISTRSCACVRSISRMARSRLDLALRQLNTTAVFMQATAHPDDENNALHVYLNRGQGVRTILATATRGDGGQNEIGPELYDPLAVLRTEELEAMHRFDATEQYFTRAIDFGYSFSIEETLEKWGRDEIISDYVRLIRMTRPDVVVGMNPTGTAGGLHHQTSGLLSREAFKAAGDPSRYPEQIREGLMPWQPRKYYYPAGGPGGGGARPARRARGRTAAAWRAEGGDVRRVGLRPAPRPHLRRDRHRRARHAQEPGDGGAARAAVGPISAALSADGFVGAASGNARGRAVVVSRHRHDHSRTRIARRAARRHPRSSRGFARLPIRWRQRRSSSISAVRSRPRLRSSPVSMRCERFASSSRQWGSRPRRGSTSMHD